MTNYGASHYTTNIPHELAISDTTCEYWKNEAKKYQKMAEMSTEVAVKQQRLAVASAEEAVRQHILAEQAADEAWRQRTLADSIVAEVVEFNIITSEQKEIIRVLKSGVVKSTNKIEQLDAIIQEQKLIIEELKK